jgi:hypothetical protein
VRNPINKSYADRQRARESVTHHRLANDFSSYRVVWVRVRGLPRVPQCSRLDQPSCDIARAFFEVLYHAPKISSASHESGPYGRKADLDKSTTASDACGLSLSCFVETFRRLCRRNCHRQFKKRYLFPKLHDPSPNRRHNMDARTSDYRANWALQRYKCAPGQLQSARQSLTDAEASAVTQRSSTALMSCPPLDVFDTASERGLCGEVDRGIIRCHVRLNFLMRILTVLAKCIPMSGLSQQE